MPVANIKMVNFLLSHFLVGINQSNSLMGDVFAEEVEWAKLFEEVVNNSIMM